MKAMTNRIQIQRYQMIVEAMINQRNIGMDDKKEISIFLIPVVMPNGPRKDGWSAGLYS